jgi:hypothetical protein
VTDHGPSPPLAPGEKDLDVLLVPRLSSNPYELVVPTTCTRSRCTRRTPHDTWVVLAATRRITRELRGIPVRPVACRDETPAYAPLLDL